VGHYGGSLTVAQRSEPKTFNPVTAVDNASHEVIHLMMADLIHINRQTQRTEPALATSWKASPDGRHYTLFLRHGIRFSDGQPFDADDVVFTFQAYLDEKLNSPQRDLLVIDDKPIAVAKLDAYTVRFDLAKPYAAAERLFDSLAIMPRHRLEQAYKEGKLAQAWGIAVAPPTITGLGPFRLKQYLPGERVVLERNPYYWKADRSGRRLPFLDEVILLQVADEDAQAIRFQAGETDVLSGVSAQNYAVLEKAPQSASYRLLDLGPGLEFNFLFFNLNDLPPGRLPQVAAKQAWFRDLRFRQAVSAAIERDAIVRLVYRGKGTPLWGPDTPGDKLWRNSALPHPARSLAKSRQLLESAGFRWDSAGKLLGPSGGRVAFSIVTSAGNQQRTQMATLIQNDLDQLGMRVSVVPLEFRALLDRLFETHDYEACVMGLANGDADPNPEMNVWLSRGSTHLWSPSEPKPATAWEAEIDRLMEEQMTTLNVRRRKQMYDRVQELLAENLPLIYLASPNILVGAKLALGNFRPAILDPYTLWNVEELFWQPTQVSMIR
jgi:peptide/nickel transport system substrate-binding protein